MSADTYIKIGNFKSDSRDQAHQEWIEVKSFNQAFEQATGGSESGAGTHARGRTRVSNFYFKKDVCPASPQIMLAVAQATPIPEITLECCRAMGEKTVYHSVTFKDATIIKYEIVQDDDAGKDGGIPTEVVGFKFDEIYVSHTPTDPKSGGKTGAAVEAAWHVGEHHVI